MQKKKSNDLQFSLTMIQAYKYNGWLYHSWQPLYIFDKNDEYLFCASKSLYVLTSKKNSDTCFKHCQQGCYTCWFFFEKEWFNIKITINTQERTITYYINIASPYLIENKVIKYIDFDIDFKCIKYLDSDNVRWHELDLNEFKENKKKYHYPQNILDIIANAKKRVLKLIELKYFVNNFSYDNLVKCLKAIEFEDLEPVAINDKQGCMENWNE